MAHDTAVESWLKANGYAFRFEVDAPFDRLNVAEANDNPGRFRKLDNDLAFQYAQDYERGDDFPAMVVQEIAGEKLWIMRGGRHRFAGAAAAAKKGHDMIVVFGETEVWRTELLCRVLNSIGVGRGESTSGKLQHIAELRKMFSRQLTLDQLAAHFRVKRATITRYLGVIASEERADRMGESPFWSSPKISQDLKIESGRLASDEVFQAVVALVKNHPADMRGDTGVDFVRKLRALGTDRARLALIIDRDKELVLNDEDKRVGKKRGPHHKTTRFTHYIRAIKRDYPGSADKLHLGDLGSCATLERLLKETEKAQDVLIDVAEEYKRLIEEMRKVEEWRAKRRGASDSDPISPQP